MIEKVQISKIVMKITFQSLQCSKLRVNSEIII